MASPVKVSDRLLALAKEEARGTHRSATAQIEHWATLGRAIEALVAYGDVLALKRVGQALPIPTFVRPDDVHARLMGLAESNDRASVAARIRAAGMPLYASDPERPGMVVEIEPDGRRTVGAVKKRRFVPAKGKAATRRT